MNILTNIRDSWRNLVAGFGTSQDKAIYQQPILNLISPQELEAMYRGDWISRKIVDIPAFDATRAWRQWQAKSTQIEAIEHCERELDVRRKLLYALTRSRLWGGAVMIMGVDRGDWNEELDPEDVQKDDLKFIHVVGRYQIDAGQIVRDIMSPWYGEPSYYYRTNMQTPPSGYLKKELTETISGFKELPAFAIHPSRVIRLVGADYPELELAPDPWGDSVLQIVQDAIRDASMVNSAVAYMISEAKLDIIKVPGLTNNMQTDAGTKVVQNRFAAAMASKSVVRATLMDMDEELIRSQLRLNGFDKVLEMYLSMACAAADVPATRLLSQSPGGQNSTGESDVRNYYDRLSSDQAVRLTPALSRLDEILIRSATGDRDESIHYDWNPLWQMDEVQKAQVAFTKAQAFKIDDEAALIEPVVLKKARENQLIEDGFYPGLEAAIDEFEASQPDEVPEPVLSSAYKDPNEPDPLELAKAQGGQKPPPGAKLPPPPGGKQVPE